MKQATLTFLIRRGVDPIVLLGRKKKGFGRGKVNGFGGKIEAGEDAEAAAVREIAEETGLAVRREDLIAVGRIVFVFPADPSFDHDVSVFVAERWTGEPRETEEMAPEWFALDALPFGEMWQDDAHWLPLALKGRRIDARFTFAGDNETVAELALRTSDP